MKKAGTSLDIYGPGEKNYLEKSVLPYINQNIAYHGMIKKYSAKWYKAYSEAKALLLPLQWEEPFGLVMIEAMACGTPVIAFDRGSAREVVKDGKTGFIVKNVNEMVKAIKKIDQIDRKECRRHIERNFTVEKMVDKYEKLYYRILKKRK